MKHKSKGVALRNVILMEPEKVYFSLRSVEKTYVKVRFCSISQIDTHTHTTPTPTPCPHPRCLDALPALAQCETGAGASLQPTRGRYTESGRQV